MKIPDIQKTIECATDFFLSQDLDAFFIVTNTPGRSAFNRVERRMVKFSKELSGVVLPHDNFGSHLNAKGGTGKQELEKKIDGHPVLAEFIIEEANQEVIKKSEA